MTAKESPKERERAELPALAAEYRAIGPAAILAALMCFPRQRQKTELSVQKAA